MTSERPESTGPVINNHGTVHNASQTGSGFVGAMGDNATGYLYVDGKATADTELRELVSQLRELFVAHAGELDNSKQVGLAIGELEEKVDDNAAPERLKRSTELILLLTQPIQAFVELIGKIHGLIEKLRA